ncbi:MAG: helix-turn-helix domain-containing protein [Caenispirillum bisanense]|nr:helix-turn-helix domain-containing protein [Caenispirillum bisanense]MCA1972230.1 helix-turn-helix domain-containing protein [Caenispirillum sp.]
MTPKAFKHWRKSLNLSQKEAAAALGLKHRIVQYYEKGERDGKPIQIPKSVRLACWALSQGTHDFDGTTAARSAPPPADGAQAAASMTS